jgi:hypothetical protein
MTLPKIEDIAVIDNVKQLSPFEKAALEFLKQIEINTRK